MTPPRWSGFKAFRALGAVAFLTCLLAGCAGGGGIPLPGRTSFASSDYYLKSSSKLWAKDTRKSEVTGTVAAGDKVTELKRNKYGWSQVEAAGGSAKGWLPTSLLCGSAPAASGKTEPAAGAPKASTKTEPAASEGKPAAAASAPAAGQTSKPAQPPKEKKDSWFSPSSAEAATHPPADPKPAVCPRKKRPTPPCSTAFS